MTFTVMLTKDYHFIFSLECGPRRQGSTCQQDIELKFQNVLKFSVNPKTHKKLRKNTVHTKI